MKLYTGTKTVAAREMSRGEYNLYRGWLTPTDDDPKELGWLVEYEPGNGKPNHPEHDGYISWSPDDVFRRHYHALPTVSEHDDTRAKLDAYERLLFDVENLVAIARDQGGLLTADNLNAALQNCVAVLESLD